MRKVKLTSPVNLAAMNAAAGQWGFKASEALTALSSSVGEDGFITVHADLLDAIDEKVEDEIDWARDEGASDARMEAQDEVAHVTAFLKKLGLSLEHGDPADIINKWRDSYQYQELLIEAIELLGIEPTMPFVVLRDRVLSAVKAMKAKPQTPNTSALAPSTI